MDEEYSELFSDNITSVKGKDIISACREKAKEEQMLLDLAKDDIDMKNEESKGSNTVECQYCNQKILIEFLIQHEESECLGKLFTCRVCNEQFPEQFMADHNRVCQSVKCSICGINLPKKEEADHKAAHSFDEPIMKI